MKRISIKKRFGKARYKYEKPEKLLYSSGKYREFLFVERRKKYVANYSEGVVSELKQKLWNERKPKIERINQR